MTVSQSEEFRTHFLTTQAPDCSTSPHGWRARVPVHAAHRGRVHLRRLDQIRKKTGGARAYGRKNEARVSSRTEPGNLGLTDTTCAPISSSLGSGLAGGVLTQQLPKQWQVE
jgi:hypothetical protein